MKMSFRSELRLTPAAIRLVAVAGLCSVLHAWTTPERVDRRPGGYVANSPAIAVEPGGIVHATWTETQASHYRDKIMYAFRDGDTWSIPANISRDSGDIRFPAIALDTLGRAVVVWSQEGTAVVRYVRQVDDTWSLPKLCFPNNGITPRLVSDSRGQIHLLFEDLAHQGGIWYSYYVAEADSWATPTRVALGIWTLGWSSLAVDRFDHLHAVWMDWGTYGIGYTFNDGTGWSTPTALPDPAPGEYSCEPRITVDTAARPHVVWQERSGGYWLYYSVMTADTWTTPRELCSQSAFGPVICCDSSDRLHVAWDGEDGLQHVQSEDTGWASPEYVVKDTAQGEIAADRNIVHVLWRDSHWNIGYSNNGVPGVGEATNTGSSPIGLQMTTSSGWLVSRFSLKAGGRVVLSVFDVDGRCMLKRNLGMLGVGVHVVELRPDSLPAGSYFGSLKTNAENQVVKFAIVE